MFLGRSTRAYRPQWSQLAIYGMLVVSTSLTLTAADREKVLFHDTSGKAELPSAKFKEDISRPMDGLQKKGASIGDNMVMPFAQPQQENGKVSKNLEKLLDKERNWIFDNSRNADQDAELKAAFGVRDYKLDNEANGKAKSVVDEYFDGPSNSSALRNRNSGQDEADKNLEGGRPLTPTVNAFDSARLPSLAPVTPAMNPFRQQQTMGTLFNNSSVTDGAIELPTRAKTQEPTGIQKLLNSWKPSPSGAQDPINLQVDVSRQELNPVVGGTANKAYLSTLGASGVPTQPGFSSSGTFNSSMGRSTVLGGLSTGATADMTSRPGVQAPASSSYPMKPQPAVLPIPRRKF